MKICKVIAAMLLVSGGALSISAVAQNYYDPNAGDSAHSQDQRQVEIHRDREQSTEQRVRELGYDSSQYARGLMGGQGEDQRRTQIQYDERNRNK